MNSKKLLVLALATAFSLPVIAQENGPTLAFSGFGTVGLSKDNSAKADFVRNLQPESSSFGLDSNLGLQLNAGFDKTFSSTLQVLTSRTSRDEFKAKLELAFVKAQLTPTASIRAGRILVPAFLISDYRNVGYANIAIRPQIDVYGQMPFSNMIGLDFTNSLDIGGINLTGNIGFGKSSSERSFDTMIESDRLYSANLTAETGSVTLRLARLQTPGIITLGGAVPNFLKTIRNAGFGKLAADLAVVDKSANFTGIGVMVDYDNIIVQTEITVRKTESFIADVRGAYLTLGYRINDITPYFTLAKSTTLSPRMDSTIPRVPALLPLARAVDSLIAGSTQSSQNIGVRWNISPSASLKVQADWVKTRDSIYVVRRPGFNGETIRAVAASVDFVF